MMETKVKVVILIEAFCFSTLCLSGHHKLQSHIYGHFGLTIHGLVLLFTRHYFHDHMYYFWF